MKGPSTGGGNGVKILSIVSFWVLLIAAILVALEYTGTINLLKDKLKNDKMNSITSTFTSDINIRIGEDGKDGYDGYAILRSKMNKDIQEQSGISLDIQGDGGDYYSRVRKLVSGDLDMAIMPIHDYLEQVSNLGIDLSSAPVIVGAVSRSIGSDGVYVNPKFFKSINDLKGLKKVDSCYTSKFMLGSMAVDAGLPALLDGQAYSDIDDTFEALMSGKCKVAGLWAPYTIMAKKKGFIDLMNSSELQLGKITDVIFANREFYVDNEDNVQSFFKNYYEATDYYLDNMTKLYKEIEMNSGGKRDKVEIAETLDGVHFYTLADNAYTLFKGHPNSKMDILGNIDAVVLKLLEMKSIPDNPLPNGDARGIVTHKTIARVFNSYDPGVIQEPKDTAKIYTKLPITTWKKLIQAPKFSRDDLDITFLRDGKLNSKAKAILDSFASDQIGNFDYYIAVVGKTGNVRGLDEPEMIKRTQAKADKVYAYLQKYYQIDPNRIQAIGMGSTMSPLKKVNQKYNSYLNENNKVEILFIEY